MDDFEYEGEQVKRALMNPKLADAVIEALIGCHFYVENPDNPARIGGFDESSQTFALQGSVGSIRLHISRLAQGYVVEERATCRLQPLLHQAVRSGGNQSARSSDDRLGTARAALLRRYIDPRSLADRDVVRLADLLSCKVDGWPPRDTRMEIAGLMKRNQLDRAYTRLASQWMEAALAKGASPLADVHIQLASAYRQIGDPEKALRCTDVALQADHTRGLTSSELSILFTVRAACHLDLYDRDHNHSCLVSARECANKSWRIQRSQECGAVYSRLEKAEAKRGRRR